MKRASYNHPTHLFISGVMRSGTTYLATLLDEHPKVCFSKPIVPEAKFFLRPGEYEKGKRYYEENYFPCRHTRVNEGVDINSDILGEKTIHYSEREDALIRIKEWYPDSKHILILRNPILRTLSHYFFSVRNKIESRSLEEVFLCKKDPPPVPQNMFISPFAYIERSKYQHQIKRLAGFFPSENTLIIIAERLFGNVQKVQEVYRWLSVDTTFVPPSLEKRIFTDPNENHEIPKDVKTVIAEELLPETNTLKDHLGDEIPEWKS